MEIQINSAGSEFQLDDNGHQKKQKVRFYPILHWRVKNSLLKLKIQHLIQWEKFTPLSATKEHLSYQHWKFRKKSHIRSFQVLTWTHTLFTIFSFESRRTQAPISLECKSRLASCVIFAVGALVTSVLKKKGETKYRMIEYTKICININFCYYIIQRW